MRVLASASSSRCASGKELGRERERKGEGGAAKGGVAGGKRVTRAGMEVEVAAPRSLSYKGKGSDSRLVRRA